MQRGVKLCARAAEGSTPTLRGLTGDSPEEGPGSGPGLSPAQKESALTPGVDTVSFSQGECLRARLWLLHLHVLRGPPYRAGHSKRTRGGQDAAVAEDEEVGSCPTFRTHPLRNLSHLTSQLGFLPLKSRESKNPIS